MPQMNGTGPHGKGQKTGRGRGRCTNGTQKDTLEKSGRDTWGRKNKSGSGQGKRFRRRIK